MTLLWMLFFNGMWIELYQSESLKCNISFDSYIYGDSGIKRIRPNTIKFDNILKQFENDII